MRELRIQKSNMLTGVYTAYYLANSHGFTELFRLAGTNKIIAIHDTRYLTDGLKSVSIVTRKDKPLYKQHMDIMMGKRPTKDIQTKAYRVERVIIDESNVHLRVEVYEVA